MLLRLGAAPTDASQRPFRFLAAWLTHEDFPRLVKDSWNNHATWISAADTFREEVTTWNQVTFGEIGRKKRHLMRRLEGINTRLRMSHVPCLEKLQKRL